jgi:CBS domain-containing protein
MRKNIDELLVEDVYDSLVSKPPVVKKGCKLKDAIDVLIKRPISRKVYVTDRKGILLGTVTVTTLLRQAGYRMRVRKPGVISFFKFLSEIFKENVEEFMEPPVCITKKDRLVDVTKFMVENRLNDLPVVDEKNKLIGELNSIEILIESRKIWEE